MLWNGVSCQQDDSRARGFEEQGRTGAKGSVTAFPELVTEDQGSWVALETEIEGVLRGFTCWFLGGCAFLVARSEGKPEGRNFLARAGLEGLLQEGWWEGVPQERELSSRL